MSSTVEMFRDAAEPKGRDRFSCSLLMWDCLQDLAREFGWSANGSVYVVPPGAAHEAPAARNYQPGDMRDLKIVDAHDAFAWATALDDALHSPRLPELLKQRGPAAVPRYALVSVVKEFAEYCYGGAFVYSMALDPKS